MKKFLVLLAFLGISTSAHAQDAFYVSGLLGLGQASMNVSGVEFDTELNYGFRAGFLFNDNVSAGLFYMRSDNSTSVNTLVGTTTFSSDFNPLMAEVTYYFNVADENSLTISGLLGVASVGNPNSTNETAVGAAIGYHFMLAPNYSLAPTITYIKTLGEDDTDAQLISALVNFTVWF